MAPSSSLVRTFDPAYISSIIGHPDCYERSADDYTPAPDLMAPSVHDSLVYLRPVDGGAVFFFHPLNCSLWVVHAAILKKARERSKNYASEAAQWMRQNTPCRCIMALVPAGNYAAMALIRSIGFKKTGEVPKSILVAGQLKDQRVYCLEV